MGKNVSDEISYDQIQSMLDETLGEKSFPFAEYVKQLMSGRVSESFAAMIGGIPEGLREAFRGEKKVMIYLFGIAVAGALLQNFSKFLKGKQVAQTAFFAIYILYFSVLFRSFFYASDMAKNTLEQLLEFMKALIPSFLISLSFTQGGVAAGVYYEFALMMIAVVNVVLVKFALPAIHVYFLLQLGNQILQEDMFSKMAELIRDFVKFIMKTMFALMMGMNVIQGLIVPVAAQVKNMTIIKAGTAIPGIGSSITAVAETVLCAGKLLKNAVGIAGILAVLWICVIPLLKIVITQFLFQIVAAVIQPVSDKRLVESLGKTVDAVRLLIYALGVGTMMFVMSIAIISAMTSIT